MGFNLCVRVEPALSWLRSRWKCLSRRPHLPRPLSSVLHHRRSRPLPKRMWKRRSPNYWVDRAYVPTVDFSQWPNFLKGEQSKLDAAKTEDEFTRDINEALTKFSASHIYLASPKASDARRTQSMVGIGISQQTSPDGTVTVMHLVPGRRQRWQALFQADVILDVDGKKAEGIRVLRGRKAAK